MKRIARALVFVICLAAFPVDEASAQTGGYVAVFGGYASNSDASWQDQDSRLDLDLQGTRVFGVKFGVTPPAIRYFSFEFEYSYLKHDVDRTVFSTIATDYAALEGDLKFHNFMFNAIARYPEGAVHPYIGAGLGASYVDASILLTTRQDGVNDTDRISTDDTAFAWQIMAGIDIDLTHNLSADIGCRYLSTEPQDDFDDDDDHDHRHHRHRAMHVDYETNMVTLGLKYRF